MKYKKVVLVDAFSTGAHLAKFIAAKGHECIHVVSNPIIPSCFHGAYDNSIFIDELVHHESFNETVETLNSLNPDLIIVGTETGVELSDSLSEALGCLTNGTVLSTARRDKYLMVEALKAAGIPTVDHIYSDKIVDILEWAKNRNKYPIVIKPVKSAGADAVTICNSQEDIVSAFQKIVGGTNQFGIYNDGVIGQGFLKGTEYIVNTVSRDENIFICDIWKCHKTLLPGAGYISCLEELLPYEGEIQAALIDYTVQTLKALGILYGPAHLEIMMTEAGPILVEIGARLQGSIFPPSISQCTGTNQVELTYEAYFEPQSFINRTKKTYKLKNYMYHLFMISKTEGMLKGLNAFERIETLPSFSHHVQRIKIGEKLPKTIDLLSSVGFIDLIHQDPLVLADDYEQYRYIEQTNLYET